MKKRHIAIVLLAGLLCAALLASCRQGNGTETNYLSDPKFDTAEALPQYDHDNTWTHRLGYNNSCTAGDTLYFTAVSNKRNYVYYCDLATGITGHLCGRPECSHNDSRCNAYTMNAHGLSVYDGRLYWIDINAEHDPTVYCMDLDGTDRTAVCSFARSQYQKALSGTIAFHRGYAIFSGYDGTVTGGAVRYNACIFAVSLSTGEVTEILDREVEDDVISFAVIAIPYRDTVYLICSETAEGQTQLDISTWSLKTHETVLLYSQMTDFIFREVWPTEDGLLFSPAAGKEIYKFDPSENTFGPLFDFCAEGRKYIPQFANDYLIGWNLTEERIPNLRVIDLEGSVVYDEELDLPDWPTQGFGYALMGADDENVYLRLESRIKENRLKTWAVSTIVQIPLDGGGTVRELWSEKL